MTSDRLISLRYPILCQSNLHAGWFTLCAHTVTSQTRTHNMSSLWKFFTVSEEDAKLTICKVKSGLGGTTTKTFGALLYTIH